MVPDLKAARRAGGQAGGRHPSLTAPLLRPHRWRETSQSENRGTECKQSMLTDCFNGFLLNVFIIKAERRGAVIGWRIRIIVI